MPLVRYELTFRAAEPVTLPPFPGPLWRGVLGRALKRMADGLDPAPLDAGRDAVRTLYRDLFETPPPAGAEKMRRYPSVPHPYVVATGLAEGPAHLAAGEEALVGLTLIGRANRALDALIAGFRRAAEAGIGKSRGRMVLERADAVWRADAVESLPVYRPGQPTAAPPVEAPPTPPMPRFIEVRLVTPLRLQFRGALVRPQTFRASDLFSALVRRVSMLSYFHTDSPLETEFRHLKQVGQRARIVEREIAWHDTYRWSAARGEELPMGGLSGWFVLDMAGLEPLWPYLWLAPWIHAGRETTVGLGAIALRPA